MMTRRIWLSALVLVTLFGANVPGDWKPVQGRIMTQWADDVDPDNPLPEYPRPQLVRDNWVNLNGPWNYAVTGVDDPQPAESEGQVLVPFCIESALSGVKRKFTRDDRLWYSRSFNAPPLEEGQRLRLNFGAVDYEATVLINGKQVETHTGGYDAFSFDITDAVQLGENTLVVSVLDAQDGPKGKQSVGALDNPRFIFYTATSGIWQTVWLETVPANHISGLKITPDIDLFAQAAAKRQFPDSPSTQMLVPTSRETAQEWRYTEEKPADSWNRLGADLSGWKKGPGVFGHKFHRNGSIRIGTEWTSPDLWVVRTFELEAPQELKRPVLRIAYDDSATVFINGLKAFEFKNGNNGPYKDFPLRPEIAAALKDGSNVIAIHVARHRSKEDVSQFIDVGIGEESINW